MLTRTRVIRGSLCSHARAIAFVAAMTAGIGAGRPASTALGQDNGAFPIVGSGAHVSYHSADVLAGAVPYQGAAGVEEGPIVGTGSSGALVINATFDASITGDPNSAAIQAMINSAVAIYENLFNDPITVNILFRYATTAPDGSALPGGALAISTYVLYGVPWNTYLANLTADATTSNDATANASLPGSALSTNILPSSAGGRAVGLSTPPAMFANGSVGAGGPYDGIVTLNSSQPFKFTRPTSAGLYDALQTTEHEMDEVMALGSAIGAFGDLRPQDLFSWSAPGTRNLTNGGSRYFSIDGGTTNLVGFNQNPAGDFGDWLSGSCPQTTPYVQNAFGCPNQASDVTQVSPEGVNLDVDGYDLIVGSTPTPTVSPTPTCASGPVAGCRTPAVSAKASLQYKDSSANDAKDQLQWKWSKGSVTTKAEFGTPLTTTNYQLCIYDGTASLIFGATIPAGGSCGASNPKPCWKNKPKGFDYKDKDLTPDGVNQLKLQEGLVAGKAQIQLTGKGALLDDPTLPFSQPVTVQLHNAESGLCWEAVYSFPASKNVAGPPTGQFKDKAD